MSEQKTFDPFVFWKDFYDQTESYWSKVFDETMQKEEFSEWMGKVLDMNLFIKKVMNESTGSYLEQVNIPSKDDLANVASLIINVESKVDVLEDMLEDSVDAQGEQAELKKEVSRLKTDVKGLDKKIDQVLDFLSNQTAAKAVNKQPNNVETTQEKQKAK